MKMSNGEEKGEAKPSEARKRAAAAKRAALKAAAEQSDVDATIGVDKRKKSRNRELVERAVETAKVSPPTNHSLRTMDAAPVVSEMARSSMGADWEDNPEHLDTPEEVREDLRDDGLDPMDVGSKDEAMFGHFLVHAFADDRDRGGRTAAQLEAEHDLVVSSLGDYDVDHDSPLDLEDIEGGDRFGDQFGVGIDLSLGVDD